MVTHLPSSSGSPVTNGGAGRKGRLPSAGAPGQEKESPRPPHGRTGECARGLPDAVLLDLRMGTPDGFEVARVLRRRAAGDSPRLVIVALSASVFASDRQQALDAGCDDFLPKPFRTGQILGVLGHLLGLQWVHAEAVTTNEAGRAVGTNAIPAEELDGLLELSRRGDVMDLRKQLEAWQAEAATPEHAARARQLMPLVVGFQVDELHARLLALRGAKP